MKPLAIALSLVAASALAPLAQADEELVGFSIYQSTATLIEVIPVVPCLGECIKQVDTIPLFLTSVHLEAWAPAVPEECVLAQCTPNVPSIRVVNSVLPVVHTGTWENQHFEQGGVRVDATATTTADHSQPVFAHVDEAEATVLLHHWQTVVTVEVRINGNPTPVPITIDYFVPSAVGQGPPPQCASGCGGGANAPPDDPTTCSPIVPDPGREDDPVTIDHERPLNCFREILQ